MATDPRTIEHLLEQLSSIEGVSARKMFGEYGVFCGDKMVALVCKDELFVKPTEQGRALTPEAPSASPYTGAKPCLQISADLWDDADWLCELIKMTALDLPAPKPKRPRKS